MENLESYPKIIKKQLEDLLAYTEKVKSALPAYNLALKLAPLVEVNEIATYLMVDIVGGITIQINGINHVNDVSPLLTALSKAGAKRQGMIEKLPLYNEVLWRYEYDEHTIVIVAYFATESSCQFVKTGIKTYKQDVFELRCE